MAAFAGQWKRSLDLAARSFDLYVKDDRKENAAQIDGSNAFIESQLGMCDKTKARVDKALAVYKSRSTLSIAALALAACNDPRGLSIIDDQQKRYPKDSVINIFFAPLIKAFAESSKGNSAAAIDATQPVLNMELGNITGFWLNWIRGQLFLRGKMGSEAAVEFKKILDHRGLETTSPFYNLSHLGLGRALMLTGETTTARTEYQNFFAAWKDADQDLPIVIEAKKEYEQLK